MTWQAVCCSDQSRYLDSDADAGTRAYVLSDRFVGGGISIRSAFRELRGWHWWSWRTRGSWCQQLWCRCGSRCALSDRKWSRGGFTGCCKNFCAWQWRGACGRSGGEAEEAKHVGNAIQAGTSGAVTWIGGEIRVWSVWHPASLGNAIEALASEDVGWFGGESRGPGLPSIVGSGNAISAVASKDVGCVGGEVRAWGAASLVGSANAIQAVARECVACFGGESWIWCAWGSVAGYRLDTASVREENEARRRRRRRSSRSYSAERERAINDSDW